MPSQLRVWDVRWTPPVNEDLPVHEERFKALLKKEAKNWCFQLERGHHGGLLHFQARVSLKNSAASSGALVKRWKVENEGQAWYFGITAATNTRNFDYQLKEDTKVRGPWTSEDLDEYIPNAYRGQVDTMHPWQQVIFDGFQLLEWRKVDCIIDPPGCNGKSTLAMLCECHGRGIDMPVCNDGDKLIQSLCNILMTTRCRTPNMVFIDIPRAVNQSKLGGMYTAVEQIKKGKVYDMRNSYKQWKFDPPQVWVFANVKPNVNYLSKDRWRFWTITDGELVPLTESEARNMETVNIDEDDE